MFYALVANAQGPVIDPLDRPSSVSVRAAASLLTAVTTAGNRLVAVGDRGIVLVSDDSGKTWKQRATPVSVMLTGVRFIDEKRGWIVGHAGVVLYSEDGGNAWRRVMDGNTFAAIMLTAAKASALAANDSPADAARRARRIADAERVVQEGADKPFLDVFFDRDIGFLAVGAFGMALHSKNGIDGWATWQERIPNDKGSHLYGVVKSGGSLYIVGEQGSVFYSADQGQSFKEIPSPYKGSFFGGVAVGSRDLLVFGLRGNAFVISGDTLAWQHVKLPTQANINHGLKLRNGGVLLLTQNGEALYSADGTHAFAPQRLSKVLPLTGAVQTRDGGIAFVGVHGPFVEPIKTTAP